MTPISHALPVDPPPPRTKALSPDRGIRGVASTPCNVWPGLAGTAPARLGPVCSGSVGTRQGSAVGRSEPGAAADGDATVGDAEAPKDGPAEAASKGKEEGEDMGVAFRELPGGALPAAASSAAWSWTAGEHPLRIQRSWVSPPAVGSRSPESSHSITPLRNDQGFTFPKRKHLAANEIAEYI